LAGKHGRIGPRGYLIIEWWKRCSGIHRRKPLIELQLIRVLDETTLSDGLFHRAVAAQQRRGSLRTHATYARELVRWITTQSYEIRHLAWLDPVAFPHLGRPNTSYFACPDRMKNGRGGGGELKGIAIAAGYEHNPAPTFLFGHGCGEKVVRLVT
jgi:hypothetical protein